MNVEKRLNNAPIILQTRRWVDDIITGLNLCPFAKKVLDQKTLFYKVVESEKIEEALSSLINECVRLDNDNKIETILIIYPNILKDFNEYLGFLELANQLLEAQNYIGIYQLASFHPDYCFDGVNMEAAENYTNRSPYPMLHLLRESSLEKALQSYSNPEQIPQRNIETAKEKGVIFFKQTLEQIKNINNDE